MKATELSISGAWLIQSDVYADDRGSFTEWFKSSKFTELVGEQFQPVQANVSVSDAGVIRGIHYSLAPHGQAKLVRVMRGAIMDVVVDARIGSPTFGQHQKVFLTANDGQSIFLRQNLAHAFQALQDETVVSYLVSSEYSPTEEKEISPLCPTLKIDWADGLPVVLSDKDLAAPTLSSQRENGLLPIF